jgi:hypothetical protein
MSESEAQLIEQLVTYQKKVTVDRKSALAALVRAGLVTKDGNATEPYASRKEVSMPGPVSDAFDPEWSTSENAHNIRDALSKVYDKLSFVLGNRKPIYILELIDAENLNDEIAALLTEQEWRILRFACERAMDSI